MIIQTVHIPRVYCSDPTVAPDSVEARLYYGSCEGLLRAMAENCVLLVDDEDRVWQQITGLIDQWADTGYRDRARAIIKLLDKRNRVVQIPGIRSSGCWGCDGCLTANEIANTPHPDIVFTSFGECPCSSGTSGRTVPGTTLAEFAYALIKHQRRTLCHILGHDEWSPGEFSEKIWQPLFRHTRTVRLLDRQLGDSTFKAVEKVRSKDMSKVVTMPSNYIPGLRWVYKEFLEHSLNPDTFEIVTQVGPNNSPESSANALEAGKLLREFARKESSGKLVPLTMTIKVIDRRSHQMHHDRYLVTDQLKLQVGRGFDLLDHHGRIRDVSLMIADWDKARAVTKIADSLEDISTLASAHANWIRIRH